MLADLPLAVTSGTKGRHDGRPSDMAVSGTLYVTLGGGQKGRVAGVRLDEVFS